VTTTTKIWPPTGIAVAQDPDTAREILARGGLVCLGVPSAQGKLVSPGFEGWDALADYTLVEADGSRQLPLKAHAEHEPVIPACSRQVICVVGLSGLHRPVAKAVHRAELFCSLADCSPEDAATPERVARQLIQEHLADTYFLNQLESNSALQDANIIASILKSRGFAVVAGSQQEKLYHTL
jgi:probable selenium-dependent hydroxylase accessory protein YqeC